jgi:putative oxidoreductase
MREEPFFVFNIRFNRRRYNRKENVMSGLLNPSASSRAWGLTVLRVVVGVIFLAHGGQKLFVYGLDGVAGGFASMGLPLPMVSAVLATGAEFFGGLLLILGLFTRVAAVPLAITMLVAGLTAHRGAFFLPSGFEYVLVLMASSVALALSGGGALALDSVLARRSAQADHRMPMPAAA